MHHEYRSIDDSEERDVVEHLFEHVEHHGVVLIAHLGFKAIHSID